MNRFSNFEETNAFVQSLLAPDKTTNVETTGNGEETLEYDMHEDTLNIDTQAKTEKSITSEITFDTIFAKQIFINAKTIQTPATKPRPTTQHVFLPGRMFYTWDLHMEAEDAPNVLVQSQSIGYVRHEISHSDLAVLKKASTIFGKPKIARAAPLENTLGQVELQPKKPRIDVIDSDEDIFADAGQDYQVAKPVKSKDDLEKMDPQTLIYSRPETLIITEPSPVENGSTLWAKRKRIMKPKMLVSDEEDMYLDEDDDEEEGNKKPTQPTKENEEKMKKHHDSNRFNKEFKQLDKMMNKKYGYGLKK